MGYVFYNAVFDIQHSLPYFYIESQTSNATIPIKQQNYLVDAFYRKVVASLELGAFNIKSMELEFA